ncbi:MAG TPA: hypothetical protein VFZ73_10040 [Gemmatimonadaceae bacterium]
MSFRRSNLRHLAVRVLLVWLLGLMAGVASACVAAPDGVAQRVLEASAPIHHPQGETANAYRLDPCERPPVATPASQPPSPDQAFTATLPTLDTRFLVREPASLPLLRRAMWPERHGEPALTIAFLRLAL